MTSLKSVKIIHVGQMDVHFTVIPTVSCVHPMHLLLRVTLLLVIQPINAAHQRILQAGVMPGQAILQPSHAYQTKLLTEMLVRVTQAINRVHRASLTRVMVVPLNRAASRLKGIAVRVTQAINHVRLTNVTKAIAVSLNQTASRLTGIVIHVIQATNHVRLTSLTRAMAGRVSRVASLLKGIAVHVIPAINRARLSNPAKVMGEQVVIVIQPPSRVRPTNPVREGMLEMQPEKVVNQQTKEFLMRTATMAVSMMDQEQVEIVIVTQLKDPVMLLSAVRAV